MKERRRYKRYAVDSIAIKGKMLFVNTVKIINISINGAYLQADRKLNIGSEYTLKVVSEGKKLTVKGIVVWSSLHERKKDARGNIFAIYSAGFKFVDTSDETRVDIWRFIEERKPDMLKKEEIHNPDGLRLHVRIPLKNKAEGVLRGHDSYKIKMLSIGGMLIMSDCPLEVEDQVPMEISINKENQIKFLGRIASCFLIKNTKPETYELGIEFLGMTDKDRHLLVEFIGLLDNRDTSSSSF
jgi:Tfp pilus assembly protein PilZ